MRSVVFFRCVILAAAAVFAVFLSGCSNTANSQKGPLDEPVVSASPDAPAGNAIDKGAGYPKLTSAVATAEIKGLDGSTYTINDKQGKILLLNLWATWCGPCRSEMPALVRMQEKHGPQGFEVIGLNTDEEEIQVINDFAAELKLNYPIAYADTALQSSMLKISKFPGIPQSFLVDRQGRLRGVFRGANPADIAKMEQVVAKLVSEESMPADQPVAAPTPDVDQAVSEQPAKGLSRRKTINKDRTETYWFGRSGNTGTTSKVLKLARLTSPGADPLGLLTNFFSV